VLRWDLHRVMNRWMYKIFQYLDRCVRRMQSERQTHVAPNPSPKAQSVP